MITDPTEKTLNGELEFSIILRGLIFFSRAPISFIASFNEFSIEFFGLVDGKTFFRANLKMFVLNIWVCLFVKILIIIKNKSKF